MNGVTHIPDLGDIHEQEWLLKHLKRQLPNSPQPCVLSEGLHKHTTIDLNASCHCLKVASNACDSDPLNVVPRVSLRIGMHRCTMYENRITFSRQSKLSGHYRLYCLYYFKVPWILGDNKVHVVCTPRRPQNNVVNLFNACMTCSYIFCVKNYIKVSKNISANRNPGIGDHDCCVHSQRSSVSGQQQFPQCEWEKHPKLFQVRLFATGTW